MRVELTGTQLGVLESSVEATHRRWLAKAELLPGHKQTYACVMPAIGWLQALGALAEFTVGPRGGNRQKVKEAALNARQRIADALSQYTAHPALFGAGLVGKHTLVIPCWILPNAKAPGRMFEVFPVQRVDRKFVWLVPNFVSGFTGWVPEDATPIHPSGISALDESSHFEFIARESVPVDQAAV